MNIIKVATAAALIATSASASAWWGNNGDFMDDFFGDAAGDFDFSFNMSARGNGYGRGYNTYRDYYGYGAPAYIAPVLTEEQQAAFTEQQQAFAEQQQKAFEQAVTAQRQQFEQFGTDPRTTMDAEFKAMQAQRAQMQEEMEKFSPADREVPAHIAKHIEESQARRDEMVKEMEKSSPADRELPAHIAKRIEESQVRRDEMIKEMETRRAEKQQQMEAYRAASMERKPFEAPRTEI